MPLQVGLAKDLLFLRSSQPDVVQLVLFSL